MCLKMHRDIPNIHRLIDAFLAVDDHLVCRLDQGSRKTYIMFTGLQLQLLHMAIRVDRAMLYQKPEHPMMDEDRLI